MKNYFETVNLRTVFLFTIFVEGFFTLSLELIGIRLSTPYVGNSADVISIIISAVLLPLSLGYSYGGKRYGNAIKKSKKSKLRNILISNILIIVVISSIGFNSVFMELAFFLMSGINNSLIKITIFSAIFLSIPSFLLGQTVPLLSNYFSSENISKITGKMLFLSTLGSFCGSIFTTLILMRYIGVAWTLVVIEIALISLLLILGKNKIKAAGATVLISVFLVFATSSGKEIFKVNYDNTYNTVSLYDTKEGTNLRINRGNSSFVSKDGKKFHEYVEVINRMIKSDTSQSKSILVIGAGGFTVGRHDKFNQYTFIDIDPDLKEIVEEKFFKGKLNGNVVFEATEVRSYLVENKKLYDLIIIDAFTNVMALPASLMTTEFYELIQSRLTEKGIAISNILASPYMDDRYSKNLDNVIRSVFKRVRVVAVEPKKTFAIFSEDKTFTNNLYVCFKLGGSTSIYTDDMNNYSFDKGVPISKNDN